MVKKREEGLLESMKRENTGFLKRVTEGVKHLRKKYRSDVQKEWGGEKRKGKCP